ncbi:MAG: hypothetical protein ACR2P2_07055 [Nakamurella sp.]
MTFLRGRPWLVPCLLVIFIGGMLVVFPSNASHPTFAAIAGSLAVVGGGVMLFGIEYGHRKSQKAARRSVDGDTAPRIPPQKA